MKCPTCGWLLSPNRPTATCPRCGSAVDGGQKAGVGSAEAGHASWGGNGSFTPSMPGSEQGSQPGFGAPGIPNVYSTPGYQVPLSPQDDPRQSWQSGSPTPPSRPGYGYQPPQKNGRLGFIVAGLCILAGALLLVFVYFMAVGGHNGTSNNGSGTGITQTANTPTAAPTSSPSAPSPTVTAYPAQRYIDNAQMSSSPPPIQATTTFKTGQKIYITFNLHPGGQKGAVCFIWYLNGQKATTYNFPASGGNTTTYAYAIFGGTGSGYVELYWASDTTCSNEQLAQRVNFTVSQ